MRKFFLNCASALTIAALAVPALAQDASDDAPKLSESQINELKDAMGSLKIDLNNIKPGTVVARVGDKTFTAEDVAQNMRQTIQTAAQAMGPEAAKNLTPEILFLIAREQAIDLYLLEKEVKKNEDRLKKDPAVQEAIAAAIERVLQESFVNEKVDGYVTKKRIRDKYLEVMKEFPENAEEVRVRMILVDTEDKANDVIKRLDRKEDFIKLARTMSIDDKLKEKEGDLGYLSDVTKDTMLPGFEVIFEKKNGKGVMAPGTYTKTPIKSPMGYHILKVEDRKAMKKPKLSEIEPMIKQLLKQEAAQKMQEEIKKNVGDIARLHPNTGKPMNSLEDELKAIQAKITSTISDMKKDS